MDHVEEMSLESPRKIQNVQSVRGETARMQREEVVKMRGGRNQEEERRRWKPKLFLMGWKASTWTLMVKIAMKGARKTFQKAKRTIIRVESEETQDCVREAKDMDQEEREEMSSYRARSVFRRSHCFVLTISARRPSGSGSLRRW